MSRAQNDRQFWDWASYYLVLGVIFGGFITSVCIAIFYKYPQKRVNLEEIISVYEKKLIEKQAEIDDKQKNYEINLQDEIDFRNNRCFCKDYSGPTDKSGRYLESINPKFLSKQEICQ